MRGGAGLGLRGGGAEVQGGDCGMESSVKIFNLLPFCRSASRWLSLDGMQAVQFFSLWMKFS